MDSNDNREHTLVVDLQLERSPMQNRSKKKSHTEFKECDEEQIYSCHTGLESLQRKYGDQKRRYVVMITQKNAVRNK